MDCANCFILYWRFVRSNRVEAMISIFSTTMLVMYPHFCKSPAGHRLSVAFLFNSILQMHHCYMHLICIESNFVLPQSLSWTHHFPHLQWEVHCLLHCSCNYTLKKMSPYCIHLICTIFVVALGGMDCPFALLVQWHSADAPLLHLLYLHWEHIVCFLNACHLPTIFLIPNGKWIVCCIASAIALWKWALTISALFVLRAIFLNACLWSNCCPNSRSEADCLLWCFCNYTLQMHHFYIHLSHIDTNFLLCQCLSWTNHFPHPQWEVDCLLHCLCSCTLQVCHYYIHINSNFLLPAPLTGENCLILCVPSQLRVPLKFCILPLHGWVPA